MFYKIYLLIGHWFLCRCLYDNKVKCDIVYYPSNFVILWVYLICIHTRFIFQNNNTQFNPWDDVYLTLFGHLKKTLSCPYLYTAD